MVETAVGFHRSGRIADHGRPGGFGRDFAAHNHRRHRSLTDVRL